MSTQHTEASGGARELLLQGQYGVLSTQSQELPGYPFGSVAPYCLDARGWPVILISALAQHTRNLRADPKASLVVLAGGADVQASARLTLVGDFEPVPAAEVEALAGRYYRFFPQTQDHHKTLDFSFWVMHPLRARFIGGFGRIHWVALERLLQANPFTYEQEAEIVAHMNTDHAEALRGYCALHRIALPEGVAPVMAGIDAEGMHLRAGEQLHRIGFEQPVSTPGQARSALAAMARASRELGL